jgi:hypothetical protein
MTTLTRQLPAEAEEVSADELHRLKRHHEQTDAQLASRSGECSEMLDRLLRLRGAENVGQRLEVRG